MEKLLTLITYFSWSSEWCLLFKIFKYMNMYKYYTELIIYSNTSTFTHHNYRLTGWNLSFDYIFDLSYSETGQRLQTLKSHTDGVTCLQFNDFYIVSGELSLWWTRKWVFSKLRLEYLQAAMIKQWNCGILQFVEFKVYIYMYTRVLDGFKCLWLFIFHTLIVNVMV